VLLAAAGLAGGGCRQDMHDQPRYEPLEASEIFADGAASRPPIAGTVARGQLREDEAFYTGLASDGGFVRALPVATTPALLARGQQRFNAYCSPCHDRAGTGRGMIVRRGFKSPSSLHVERLRQAQVGYFYDVISNGFGQMSSYAAQVAPADRWAIVAYIRALQLAHQARLADLPPAVAAELRREIEEAREAGRPGGGDTGGETAGHGESER
jgi:mono/diheme cytochrome c family protein